MGRKGELSRHQINHKWPYQVAKSESEVRSRFEHVMSTSKLLGCAPRHHCVVYHGEWHLIFCFASTEAAAEFKSIFGGIDVDPEDLGKGSSWNIWTPGKAAAQRAARRRY